MPVALSGYWRLQEYPADGCRKIQLRQTGRRCRTVCSLRTDFIQLHGPINAGDGVNRADHRAGCIFTVVTELRRRFFHSASLSGAALIAGRAGDASLNRRPHKCGSRYRAWSQQLQNDSPGIPQVIVIFDENMPMKCHFRHSSTRPSPDRRNACKTGKA